MAKETGRAPSEVVGIGCDFCGYAFDEALVLRGALHEQKAAEESENRARFEGNRRKMLGD